jgi:hypothetical protein
MDYLINRDWLINMSVWYMDIDTTASYKMGGVQQRDSVRLDPWVFMFSAGYRFKFFCKTLCKTGHQMTSFFHSFPRIVVLTSRSQLSHVCF